ncbi:MAG: hypothetical protein IJZ75_06335 [Clostridia bacterium]|nr:hypothetical protein [Clostridia bacterium]
MFNNIGKKIQVLAKTLCWIGIVVAMIFGIVLIASGIVQKQFLISIGGVGVAFIYAVLSWLCSFTMVGYGELIEKVNSIENKMTPHNEEKEVIE